MDPKIVAQLDYMLTQHTEILRQHELTMRLHTRALACHCECLGMNAENSRAVCEDSVPPYADADYFGVMQKWGLLDGNGQPTEEV